MAWRLRCPCRSSLTPGLPLLRQLLAREVHVRQGMSRRVLHSACEPRDEAVLHVRHHHQAPNGWHDLAVFLVSVWHRPVSLRYLASEADDRQAPTWWLGHVEVELQVFEHLVGSLELVT